MSAATSARRFSRHSLHFRTAANTRKHDKFQARKPGTTKGKPQRARELKQKGLSFPEIAQALETSVRTVLR